MALQAMWVHGTSFRSEWVGDNLLKVPGTRHDGSNGDVNWSDVNGLPRGWGATFRGRRSLFAGFVGAIHTGPPDVADPFRYSLKGYWFHVPIPTPVIRDGRRSTLLRVFVLWEATGGVSPAVLHVWDGPIRIEMFPFTHGATGRCGHNGVADLVDGVTRFNLPAAREVLFGLALSVGVYFQEDGNITFCTAGADFDV